MNRIPPEPGATRYRLPDHGKPSRFSEPLSALVDRVDLSVLVETYSGPGRHQGATWTYRCPNPDHPDRSPSFTVTRGRDGRWRGRCWSQCADRGTVDALGLVMWLHGDSPAEAAARLRGFLGEPEPWAYTTAERRPVAPIVAKPTPTPEPITYTPPVDTTERLAPAEAEALLDRYLRSRGWPSEVVDRFGLEAIRDTSGVEGVRHPFYVNRPDGSPVVMWWQDRLRTRPGVPKWKAPKGHRPIPYNLPALERDGVSFVVVCEGPADTITTATALHGSPDVAVIGVPGSGSWMSGWAEYLRGLVVIVATDDDSAGDKLADRIAADLRGHVIRYRPRHGDMTDTAKAVGMTVIGDDLRHRLVTIATETVMASVFGPDGWSWVVTEPVAGETEAVA